MNRMASASICSGSMAIPMKEVCCRQKFNLADGTWPGFSQPPHVLDERARS
jgi:hypothetical protein